MGKFKDYLLNEDIGLGDLGARIDQFVNNPWLGNKLDGAFVTKDNHAANQPNAFDSIRLPSTDPTIPSVEKTGRITCLLLKKNPIYVRLSDGTEAHFSFDEWKRIEGQPALGKTMTIVFQRHPQDWTQQASKIDHVMVTD